MPRTIFTLTLLMLTLVGANSSNAKSFPWDKVTKVCYYFGDAPKPAYECRDYSIIIDANNIWLSVRCGNKILIERRYDNTPEKFQKIIKKLRAQGFIKTEEGGTRERGCSSEQVTFYASDQCVFSAYNEGNYGNLYVKNGTAASTFKAAVPESVDNIIHETFYYQKK